MLLNYLNRFSEESGMELSAVQFDCGEALLENKTDNLDMVILDVQMSGKNGLETARCIRKNDQDLMIIFFTNYIEYALEGYEVQAYRFLLKPLDYQQFFKVVGKALEDLHLRRKALLILHAKGKNSQIPVDSLQYVETYKGHVLLHTAAESVENFTAMKKMEDALRAHDFVRCHTAFLVSMREIKTVGAQDIVLRSGKVIPMSKHRRKSVREAVALYWGGQFL